MQLSHRAKAATLVLMLASTLSLGATSVAATLPRLEADSLGGNHVVLPRDAGGKPLVLLLAYTKESESDLKSWSRALLNEKIEAKAAVYVIVVADRTAFFARKGIRKSVQGATVGNQDQTNNNVLITFNGAGWRELVPPGDKRTIGVVVCDTNGSIVYAKRQPFSNAGLREVEQADR